MGLATSAPLLEPVTDKFSEDETNGKLKLGASCMQGWRKSVVGAHNCVLDFDVNTSLFAIYDGHGGDEVAVYCSKKLPKYIKTTYSYKDKHFRSALIDAFLGFDATLATNKVIAKLRKIATRDKSTPVVDTDSSSSELEETVEDLCEEAAMPLEQVLEKYGCTLKQSTNLQKEGDKESPFQEQASLSEAASNESSTKECAGSSSGNSKGLEDRLAKISETDAEIDVKCIESTNNSGSKCNGVDTKPEDDLPNQNVKVETSQEKGEIDKKGKGKATSKTKGVPSTPLETTPERDARQLYDKLRASESLSDSEDEEDTSFEGPNEDSCSEEHLEVAEISSESSTSEEDDDDNCAIKSRKKPGFDSGCTALVALLHERQLYVASVGDSRCIVCRDGKAVEMSFDHKPFNKLEHERITKAGGEVGGMGRLDGIMTFSRAIGDHSYKQNKKLSDREQKITALPDVHTLTINPNEDEFMVLACDGIWTMLDNQDVIDFIRPKIQTAEKLSQICEELCDYCLAKDTHGHGEGCDNMTVIIVQFTKNMHKRYSDEAKYGSLKQSKIK